MKKATVFAVLFTLFVCTLFAEDTQNISARVKGLWYRTTNEKGESTARYIYFDRKAKEVVFFYDNTEELYVWMESHFWMNSATIKVTNAAIKTLNRTILITASGGDFIITVKDSVLAADESNLWNGTYRKKTGSGKG